MDNRWILIIIVILACIPIQVSAYNNIGAHPSINRYAVDYFENNLRDLDPLLIGTTLRGQECWGYAWDEIDGRADSGPRNQIRQSRSKLLHHWIRDGGYSADEPEVNMGLVHFFDPMNNEQPYLTDVAFLRKAAEIWYDFKSPYLSAVDWAFDRDGGNDYYIQDYSWNDGLRYYMAALASDSRMNPNYGQAWRAVGETMHLISDMTVPAHVRNDGHPLSEPYEASVGAWEVTHYKAGNHLGLNYDQGTLRDLMVHIATVVNKKFYSADTTPVRYVKPGSGNYYTSYSYPQPSLEGLVPDAEGYYYLDGRALAREDMSLFQPALEAGVLRNVYRLDEKVLNDQRNVLIPTAIRASAEVLDRFLPRFVAQLSVKKFLPEDPDDDQYIVHATLKQVHIEPDSWTGYDLIVRNGAYLIETPPGGKPSEGPLSLTPLWAKVPPDPNFNDWTDLYKFKPGTTVQMKYDLGGYVLKSNEVVIPEVTPTPTTPRPKTTTTTPTPYETTGIVTHHPTSAGYVPACGPGGNCQKCCIWVNQTNLVTGEQGYWAVRALCNCNTGEDLDPSAVDTNIWNSLPQR